MQCNANYYSAVEIILVLQLLSPHVKGFSITIMQDLSYNKCDVGSELNCLCLRIQSWVRCAGLRAECKIRCSEQKATLAILFAAKVVSATFDSMLFVEWTSHLIVYADRFRTSFKFGISAESSLSDLRCRVYLNVLLPNVILCRPVLLTYQLPYIKFIF